MKLDIEKIVRELNKLPGLFSEKPVDVCSDQVSEQIIRAGGDNPLFKTSLDSYKKIYHMIPVEYDHIKKEIDEYFTEIYSLYDSQEKEIMHYEERDNHDAWDDAELSSILHQIDSTMYDLLQGIENIHKQINLLQLVVNC